jgi:hypothetical protein
MLKEFRATLASPYESNRGTDLHGHLVSFTAMSNSPTVAFDTSRLTETVLADVESNSRELPEIDEWNFDVFYDLVVRTFAAGRDLHGLSTGILAMNIDGMTARRAASISTQLWSPVRELMDRERQVELGISRVRWMYSHAPCMVDPRAPTPDDLRQDAVSGGSNHHDTRARRRQSGQPGLMHEDGGPLFARDFNPQKRG